MKLDPTRNSISFHDHQIDESLIKYMHKKARCQIKGCALLTELFLGFTKRVQLLKIISGTHGKKLFTSLSGQSLILDPRDYYAYMADHAQSSMF